MKNLGGCMNQAVVCSLLVLNIAIVGDLRSNQDGLSEQLMLTISCLDLHQKMQQTAGDEQSLYVINVLPKSICKDCKIPGTLNIPVDKLIKKVRNWPKSREIIIHCAGNPCPLGRHAYQILKSHGFANVWLFDGGLRCWKRQNLPTHGRCRAGYLKG